jgi:molybdate transport system substrate-binding protein
MRIRGLVLCIFAAVAQTATAAEIKLLAPGALHSTLDEVIPKFEREAGHTVKIEYGPAGPLAARVRKGESADAAILSRAEVGRLVKEGLLRGGDNPDIARVGIGVMVRKGQPKPDISSIDKLKAALRSANTIGVGDPTQGAASAYLFKTFSSWGMDDELKPKIRVLPLGSGLYGGIEKGVAELGFAPVSEILARKNTLELVGPVPADMQMYNRFAAGVLVSAKEPAAAASLIRYLTAAEIAPVLQRNGLEAK